MPSDYKWIEWFFSGIGTYIVQIIVSLLSFLFVVIFVKKRRKDNISIRGDSYKVKQKGFFNKINFNNNKNKNKS